MERDQGFSDKGFEESQVISLKQPGEFQAALLKVDHQAVRRLIDAGHDVHVVGKDEGTLLHELMNIDQEQLLTSAQRRPLVYMLSNAGVDVTAQDQNGNTALHLAIKNLGGDPEVCEPLLQCGSDMFLQNKEGEEPLKMVLSSSEIPKTVQELFRKYQPGLFRAVETDDLLSVRKLVNLWCRVDIVKNDKKLRMLTLEKGTENIIRLVKEIEPSMKLAHGVLSEDIMGIQRLFAGDFHINTEFKNLGDMGATPLFYAILQNNVKMVQLLRENGARPDSVIAFEDEDIPILFAALNAETDPEIIKCLVPAKDKPGLSLSSLHYRGRHVLLQCIESGVCSSAVRHILLQGYSELLAIRNQRNECARDMAMRLGRMEYVTLIDEVVHEWYLDGRGHHRKQLAYMGYPHLRDAKKDGVRACDVVQTMETSAPPAQFDSQLQRYQDQIERFVKAVDAGNVEQAKKLLHFDSSEECFHTCLANARAHGDGQPPLHKAVLRKHVPMIEFLAEVIVHKMGRKLDEVRDQWYRPALHYAYSMEDGKQVANTLLDFGSSEFTMDQDLRSPLVFKDFQRHPQMKCLLQWHIDQDYSSNEPEPWSTQLPPRVRFQLQQQAGRSGLHSHGCPHDPRPPPPSEPPVHQRNQQAYSWTSYCNIL